MKHLLQPLDRYSRAISHAIFVHVVGRLLFYSGVLFLIGWLRQRVGRARLIIPMYHRVRDNREPAGSNLLGLQRGVPIELFERHLRVFRWFGPLKTLGEAYDHLQLDSACSRTVLALTFDDGYRDNVTLAMPVLERLNIRATIFPVVRTAAGGRPLWWDEMSDVIAHGAIDGDRLGPYFATLEHGGLSMSDGKRVRSAASREAIAGFICGRLVEMPDSRREGAIAELVERLAARPTIGSAQLYAGWDELHSMSDAGFEIGGHTLDHVVLPLEEPPVAEAQISGCRTVLEREFCRPIRSFAYPNGRNDATVRSLVSAAGFRVAVTVDHGVNYGDTDPLQLHRMPVSCEQPHELALKLAFYGCVHGRK